MNYLFIVLPVVFCLGFALGWWIRGRSMQRKINAIDTQLKLNQAKMLDLINANIRLRKNVR